jgi:hypothetical protein
MHHEFTAPTCLAAEYAHPVEYLVLKCVGSEIPKRNANLKKRPPHFPTDWKHRSICNRTNRHPSSWHYSICVCHHGIYLQIANLHDTDKTRQDKKRQHKTRQGNHTKYLCTTTLVIKCTFDLLLAILQCQCAEGFTDHNERSFWLFYSTAQCHQWRSTNSRLPSQCFPLQFR